MPFTNSRPAFISNSLDGRITAWDRNAEYMFGYTADEAIGRHISIIIPFEYQDEEYELLDRLKKEDYLEVRETVRRMKAGRLLLVKISAAPVRNAAGKVVGAVKKMQAIREIARGFRPREKARSSINSGSDEYCQLRAWQAPGAPPPLKLPEPKLPPEPEPLRQLEPLDL